ncbi:hypothetical protein ACHAWO_005982 [Cyclotella atomus]|uniref:Uncharacterized protein n=1 Tax=Cyclotella atomus TaxID=382360 RepID=A0ABD3PC16_9STRA
MYSASSGCRRVSFDSVEVREYDVTIGDNPSCRSGPPISLDWSFSVVPTKNIDDFELQRFNERVTNKSQLCLSKYTRRNMLLFCWGFTEEELKKATRQVNQIQRQRTMTESFMLVHMMHEAFQELKVEICKGLSHQTRPRMLDVCKVQGNRIKHKRRGTNETIELSLDDEIGSA